MYKCTQVEISKFLHLSKMFTIKIVTKNT